MSPTPEASRRQVLAYRYRAQGLDRSASDADARTLPVWDLGLQDSPTGSAALALTARLPGGFDAVPDLTDARRFVTVWGTRGAPLVLRAGDVAPMAAALWPLDEGGAVANLAGNGQQLRKQGNDPVEAIRVTAKEMRAVVRGEMTKGEVSEALTPRLPSDYITWCRGCQAHHLGDQLMRVAGLPAGLRLVPGTSPATLTKIAGWKGPPRAAEGTDELVLAYLHLCGPASATDVTAYLQTSASTVRTAWPGGLAEVRVDGRKASLPEDDLEALLDPPDAVGVRLLPRSDPWLLARDRKLVVPDAARRKVLWPPIGWPGAVLVDGEVAAAWRARSARSGHAVEVTVEQFTKLSPKVRSAAEDEAAAVATQRGVDDLRVTFD